MPGTTVADDDIRHAVRHAIREVAQGVDRVLHIGGGRAGRLLEVVVLDPDHEPVAIHAVPSARSSTATSR